MEFLVSLLDQDLHQYVKRATKPQLPAKLVKSYTYQLLHALAFCHARRVVHRDLKPANLLVDKQGALKVADFSLARAFSVPLRKYTHEVVTLWYRAPEILLGSETYSTPVDVWSVGCILAELSNGVPLFPGDSEIDELRRIFQALGTPSEASWPGVTKLRDYSPTFPSWPKKATSLVVPSLCPAGVDLFDKMMAYEPGMRISAKAALEHPYFDDLDKSAV